MKNSVSWGFTFVLAALFSTVCPADDGGVLLRDGFENGKAAPNGWKKGSAIPGVKYYYDKRLAKSGSRSLSLQKSANRYFPIAQWSRVLPLDSDTKAIKINVQVRARKASKAIVDVIFLDSGGNMKSHQWASYIGAKEADDPPADHDWKPYTSVVEIPEGTKKVQLGLQIYGPGKVWFDNLEVLAAGPGSGDTSNAPASSNPLARSNADIADSTIKIEVGPSRGEYLFEPARAEPTSAAGAGLLVVLPGGAGTADFFPFIRRMHQNSVSDDFALAQPIAKKWTPDQVVVWPTAANRTASAKYTTEELVSAVVEDIAVKSKIDRRRVFVLAWSSGGPAAYATLLHADSPLAGGLIAMSVFKPDQLPDLRQGTGKGLYLLHSPDDRVCPYWMAKEASESFSRAGIRNTLVDYPGGHGWRGDVYGNIRRGIQWLDESAGS